MPTLGIFSLMECVTEIVQLPVVAPAPPPVPALTPLPPCATPAPLPPSPLAPPLPPVVAVPAAAGPPAEPPSARPPAAGMPPDPVGPMPAAVAPPVVIPACPAGGSAAFGPEQPKTPSAKPYVAKGQIFIERA